MVLAQAKSTDFIGKGCWDQGYLSPTVLIFHSCYHNTSLVRLVARGTLHWVHVWLTLQSLGCKHVHKDVHISTKEVQSWFKWDPYLILLWLCQCCWSFLLFCLCSECWKEKKPSPSFERPKFESPFWLAEFKVEEKQSSVLVASLC